MSVCREGAETCRGPNAPAAACPLRLSVACPADLHVLQDISVRPERQKRQLHCTKLV
jgi:hypothetical protein